MVWKRLAFILSIVLILVAIPLLTIAQNGQSVSVGDVITDQLTLENPSAAYTILAAEGDHLLLSLRSSDFDSYLTLLAQNGSIVAEDDDDAGGKDALIDAELPATGLYTIQASSYNQASTGTFSLTIAGSVSAIPTPTPVPTRAPLERVTVAYGESLDGTLTVNDVAAEYIFDGQQGERVTITLTSRDFDTYLILEMADGLGGELITDDDSAGNLNARIEDFELPATGTYLVRAGSYGGGAEGSYTLTLESALGQAQITPTPQPDVTATETAIQNTTLLVYGASIDSALDDTATPVTYSFEGKVGDRVTLTLTSPDFDAFLSLSADGETSPLAEDDDTAGNLNARIENFELPSDGLYTMQVSSIGDVSGEYTLTLEGAASQTTIQATQEAPSLTLTATLAPIEITPSGGNIQFGAIVDGALTPDQPAAVYFFDSDTGQTVTIVATSGEFDVFLTLSGSNGNVLTSDDDSAGNLNARIENFILPANDTYMITVSSFAEGVSGAFTLILETSGSSSQPTPTPTTASTANAIRLGQTINGSLRAGQQSTTYTFEGENGQTVSITARSETFDTYLRVSDSDGVELVYDDDSGGNLDSRITLFQVPRNDTYTITVESYDGNYGDFSLELGKSSVRNIEYTQTVNETLAAGEIAAYRFRGNAGESIVINLSGTFDTYLTLADFNGVALIENDDAGNTNNSLIGPYTLLADGTYLVYVRSYDNAVGGTYTLRIDRAELIGLGYGEDINAVFEVEGGPMYFDFEGSYGDVISIRVNSDDTLDTALILNGPDGNQLIADEDGGAGFDPEILNFALNQDGLYTIVLRTAVLGDSGQVNLTLKKADARSLDDGPQEVTLGDQRSQDFVSFTGRSGERVLLTVKLLTPPTTYSPYVSVQQGEQTLYYGYGAYLARQVVELIIPADGEVIVELEFYDTSETRLRLSLEIIGS